MKHLRQILAALMTAAICLPCAAATTADEVRPLPASVWQRPLPNDPVSAGACRLLEKHCLYALNTWRDSVMRFTQQKGEFLDFGGKIEKHIRPIGHEAFTLALALRWGICRPEVTKGVSRSEAERFCCQLIESMAYRHLANSGKEHGWGDQWQSALWAAQGALAAWIMWDKLSANAQRMVVNMTEHEANRFIDYTVPYYRDLKGNIVFPGDTKAEENAWNSNILTAAIDMLPNNPNREAWQKKNIELQLSAFATPADAESRKKVDGVRLCDLLKGSNMYADGTVVNHNRLHPDYMVSFMHNATNAWVDKLAGRKPLHASWRNGDLIYRALTQKLFNGHTIYVQTADGKATAEMYYPEGNDWGTGRQENYWLMDVIAHIFHYDNGMKPKAYDWAMARTAKMLKMIERSGTGQFYMSREESSFDSREAWFGAQVAWGLLGLWLNN